MPHSNTKKAFSNDPIWAETLKRFMKSEMAKSNQGFSDLAKSIEEHLGLTHKEENLKQKFNRGNFGAQLFLQSLIAMDIKTIKLETVNEIYQLVKSDQRFSPEESDEN